MKILIIGCYKLADGYKAMSNGIRYLGHTLSFFPLFSAQDVLKYKTKENYNITDEVIKCLNGEKLSFDLPGYINVCSDKVDHCIVWQGVDCCDKYSDMFKTIKKETNINLIQINWDPNPNFINHLVNYYKYFDYIFSVNSKITNYLLKELKFKNAFHFNQSFDDEYSFYSEDDEYKCDVSILCTNLYTNHIWKNKKICRKKLLDIIYANKSINLHVYGPDFLKKHYPNAYKGYLPYMDSNLVFSNSLINLNISPVGDSLTDNFNGQECYYFSERLPQILGSSGLMVCDQSFGIFLENGTHYIKIDKEEDILEIVKDVKNNPKKYNKIRRRGFKKAIKHLNSTVFGEYILGKIGL